jgi:hypothetical protein
MLEVALPRRPLVERRSSAESYRNLRSSVKKIKKFLTLDFRPWNAAMHLRSFGLWAFGFWLLAFSPSPLQKLASVLKKLLIHGELHRIETRLAPESSAKWMELR